MIGSEEVPFYRNQSSGDAASKRYKKIGSASCLFSMIFLVLGFVIFYAIKPIIYGKLRSMLPISNSSQSQTYSQFMQPSVPIYMQFWLYHVVNPQEILAGKKAQLKQIGPFTYSEHRLKENVSFQDDGKVVGYRERKHYQFNETMSAYHENYSICAISLGKAAVLSYLDKLPSFIASMIAVDLDTVQLFSNRTALELIWGYEDPALQKISKLAPLIGMNISTYVGLMVGKQDVDGPVTLINTGAHELKSLGMIEKYDGNSSLNIWNTSYANAINGSDGSLFHPFLKRKDILYVFSSDLCRSIYFEYVSSEHVNGLPVYKFMVPARVFLNATLEPNNVGFCVPKCYDSGVLDVSTCQTPKAPVIMSQPQFTDAAAQYRNSVIGLDEESDMYRTELQLEPITGVVVRAQKRIQINFNLQPLSLSDTKNIKPVFLPIVWLNESSQLPDDLIHQLYNSLYIPMTISIMIGIVLWILAGICLLVAISMLFLIIYRKSGKNNKNYEPL